MPGTPEIDKNTQHYYISQFANLHYLYWPAGGNIKKTCSCTEVYRKTSLGFLCPVTSVNIRVRKEDYSVLGFKTSMWQQ